MGLKLIRSDAGEALPEYGWGIVGESLGDASSELLLDVLPLDQKDEALRITENMQANPVFTLSWFTLRVSRVGEEPLENGGVKASYIEASNLTHPG